MSYNKGGVFHSIVVCAFLAMSASPLPAQITEYTWTGAGDGVTWRDPANWETGGEPAATAPLTIGDKAVFSKDGAPYAVEFGGGVTNYEFEVAAGEVTFDIGAGNTYLVTNMINICKGNSQTGVLRVVSGTLKLERPTPENDMLRMSYGNNSKSTLILEGPGTLLWSNTRIHPAYNKGGESEVYVLDGAELSTHQVRVADKGKGYLMVSNATVSSSFANLFTIGSSSTASGEAYFLGKSAITNFGAINVGSSGEGSLYLGPRIFVQLVGSGARNIYVGVNSNAKGTLTLDGTALTNRVLSVGNSGGNGVTEGVVPAAGGVGTVNLLNGAFWHLNGFSGRTIYVGPESALRFRDSRLDGRYGSSKDLPLWMREDSKLTVELTKSSHEAYVAATPMIRTDAKGAATCTNLIEDVAFELVLTESYEHEPNREFHLFEYAGTLRGEFVGKRDGESFYVDGRRFSLDYGAGAAGSIILRAEAPLGSMLIIK